MSNNVNAGVMNYVMLELRYSVMTPFMMLIGLMVTFFAFSLVKTLKPSKCSPLAYTQPWFRVMVRENIFTIFNMYFPMINNKCN